MENEISVTFNKEQYEKLLTMVAISSYVIDHTPEEDNSDHKLYEELRTLVYSKAKDVGLGALIEEKEGQQCESEEFEESGFIDLISNCENETFWESLIEKMAITEFARESGGYEALETMDEDKGLARLNELHTKYANEFDENDLENVGLINQ